MTDAPESDEDLLGRYARGEARAFELLYRRHEMRVWRYLERNVGNRATADELMQEVWFAVARDARRFEPGSRFAPWLFAIARHRMLDAGAAGRRLVSLEEVGYEAPPVVEQLTTEPSIGPLAAVTGARAGGRGARAALGELPGEQRDALLLQLEGELSVEEVAAITRSSFETTKSRLRYARTRLRELLAGKRMNTLPPGQEPHDELDELYRRASERDPSRPSEATRRAVLAHAERVAAAASARRHALPGARAGGRRLSARSPPGSWRPSWSCRAISSRAYPRHPPASRPPLPRSSRPMPRAPRRRRFAPSLIRPARCQTASGARPARPPHRRRFRQALALREAQTPRPRAQFVPEPAAAASEERAAARPRTRRADAATSTQEVVVTGALSGARAAAGAAARDSRPEGIVARHCIAPPPPAIRRRSRDCWARRLTSMHATHPAGRRRCWSRYCMGAARRSPRCSRMGPTPTQPTRRASRLWQRHSRAVIRQPRRRCGATAPARSAGRSAAARPQWRLKYCTARSCRSAAARVLNVPRLRRRLVRGSSLRE